MVSSILWHLSYRKLSQRVVNLIDADWCESNGCADLVAKDLCLRITIVCIDKHSRDNSVAVESLSVCEMCIRLACVTRSMVPIARYQYSCRYQKSSNLTYHPPFVKDSFAKSSRSPGSVLNRGSSPVLSFKNISL